VWGTAPASGGSDRQRDAGGRGERERAGSESELGEGEKREVLGFYRGRRGEGERERGAGEEEMAVNGN
jgi:hypothetical protein